MDFEYPPAPPTDLADADVTATIPTGQYRVKSIPHRLQSETRTGG